MSRQSYPTQLRDHLGNEVRLPPKPFAVGGEGAVFDVQGQPNLVAKLYSSPRAKNAATSSGRWPSCAAPTY